MPIDLKDMFAWYGQRQGYDQADAGLVLGRAVTQGRLLEQQGEDDGRDQQHREAPPRGQDHQPPDERRTAQVLELHPAPPPSSSAGAVSR